MLVSLAWRNLSRNRRRTLLTGVAVSSAVVLLGWLVGFTYGAYDQMIDKAVRTRIGHLQVMREGYLDQPAPDKVVPDARAIASRIAGLPAVQAVNARVLAEGLIVRDNELSAADLLGVDPAGERGATIVPEKVLRGPQAVRWCRSQMADAVSILGGDERLFDRWCAAAGQGEFLPPAEPRAIALGRNVAKRLLVSVGDEVTVQVIRPGGGRAEPGGSPGGVSQRRLVVTGVVATGSPEIDDRAGYVHAATLLEMLGTDGPNEITVVLHSISDLEATRDEVRAIVGTRSGLVVHTWAERNPTLANLIGMAKGSRAIFFAIIGFLVILSVANATLMSILERTKELGVMLALGLRRSTLVAMLMTEVALLGALAVGLGSLAAAGLEAYGRIHGWPLAWTGFENQTLEEMSISGLGYDTTFYARMPTVGAVLIVLGVYVAFLVTALAPVLKAARLKAIRAMRDR